MEWGLDRLNPRLHFQTTFKYTNVLHNNLQQKSSTTPWSSNDLENVKSLLSASSHHGLNVNDLLKFKDLQFVIVHNSMDYGSIDAIRRAQCAIVTGEGHAACTRCF
eukprot:1352563-Amorphochlora_amoeboformis.AAC.1